MILENQTYVQQLENTVTGLEDKIDELVKENIKLSDENKNLRKFERFYKKEADIIDNHKKSHYEDSNHRPIKSILLSLATTASWISFFVGIALSVSGMPGTGLITMITSLFFFIGCANARSNA